MTIDRTASDVNHRFDDELGYVDRYVRLLIDKSTLHDRQVMDLNRILGHMRIEQLPERHYNRIGDAYSADEIQVLLTAIRAVEPRIYQTILGHEKRLDDIPSNLLNTPAAAYVDRLDEWIDCFVGRLSDDPDEAEVRTTLQHAMREAQTVDQELDEDERIPTETLRDLLANAIDHAIHVKVRQRVDEMVYARQQFEEIEVLARMATPNAEIDVLRQGFVLVMTAFDAAIFDLARIAFRRKFFQLVGSFGKGERISLEAIGEAGSFEKVRDQIIEEQLKKRYAKDLLAILQSLGVELVDPASGDRAIQLTEMVLRRNLHIHNRGVVDERYLERDSASGKPKYNLFDLKLGDAAIIDDGYFDAVKRLSKNCVARVAQWCTA